MKIETSWELEGRQQGLLEGHQQGMIVVLASQLAHRFEAERQLSHIRAMLSVLSTEQLGSLGLAMFDLASVSDLEEWISKQAGQ